MFYQVNVQAFVRGSLLLDRSRSACVGSLRQKEEDAAGPSTMEEYVKLKGGQRPITKILIANNGIAAVKVHIPGISLVHR